MVRKILVIVAMLASCASAEARGRRFQSARAAQATYERPQSTSEPVDATDEVNALRVSRGVPPLIRDELLVQGAMACAKYRGSRSMFGHTANDFKYLPPGAMATAGGCAAYPPSSGWMSCCDDEPQWRVGGAAYVVGADGNRYMELFVR